MGIDEHVTNISSINSNAQTANGIQETNVNNQNNSASPQYNEKTRLEVLDKKYLINDDDQVSNISNTNQLSSKQANVWRKSAVGISWISIIITLTIGIVEFVVAKNEDSSAAFGLAFSSLLDVLTSVVVLWRYYKAYDTFSKQREHISCVVLGVLFIVSSIGIAVKAIHGLLDGDSPDMSDIGVRILVITSIVATCLCVLLFVIKVIISKILVSWTIFTDALNSLVGAIIALSMVITSEATKLDHFLWFLDSTVGLTVSLFLLIYGLCFRLPNGISNSSVV